MNKHTRLASVASSSSVTRERRKAHAPQLPSTVSHEAVLVVEDDVPILQLYRWTLQRLGYSLLEARNGREALDVLARHPGRLDLLLTDVVMPEMDGFSLAERVAAVHPEAGILFVTAYSAEMVTVSGGLAEAGHAFLLKPFTADSLVAKMREVLDRPVKTGEGTDMSALDGQPDAP